MNSDTWYFEDVFKDEASFTQYLSDYSISLPITITASQLYNLFLDKYLNCTINFDTIEVFKRRFKIMLDDYLKEYAMRVATINKMYTLSDDELLVVNTFISNYANNPNFELSDVYDELGYVSAQNNGINRFSKLDSYIKYLKALLPYGNREFLDRFKTLFKYIYIRGINIYENN